MNRNQFLIVTSLSTLVVVLLILQVVLGKMAAFDQGRLQQAQLAINQGQVCLNNLQKLAVRIATLSQQTGDQGLKDLLARQQIQIGNPPAQATDGNNTTAPAPQPAYNPPTTR